MRGSRIADGLEPERRGPIPAHAGEPTQSCRSGLLPRAYPRACGGADSGRIAALRDGGLSPRMRGSRCCEGGSGMMTGPIPAHAGEPHHASGAGCRPRAYPRACGGAGRTPDLVALEGGLSPRMRGSQIHHPEPLFVLGPIPAHAGEPVDGLQQRIELGAYPRACGGAAMTPRPSRMVTGLSPRMRGSQFEAVRQERCAGPIPAHAGEPKARSVGPV